MALGGTQLALENPPGQEGRQPPDRTETRTMPRNAGEAAAGWPRAERASAPRRGEPRPPAEPPPAPGKVRPAASPPPARASPRPRRRRHGDRPPPHPHREGPAGRGLGPRAGGRSGGAVEPGDAGRRGRGGRGGARSGSRGPGAAAPPRPGALTLHFAEGADPQRVPQDVVADLHPPVVFLLLGRRHLPPGTEPAHGAAGGGGGGGQGRAGGGRGCGDAGGGPRRQPPPSAARRGPAAAAAGADAPPGGAGTVSRARPLRRRAAPAHLPAGPPAGRRAAPDPGLLPRGGLPC